MPSEMPFHPARQPLRRPTPGPRLHVSVLHVFRNPIWKDVVHESFSEVKAGRLNQPTSFFLRVGVSHRASRLRLRVLGNKLPQPPELTFSVAHKDPEHFPGITVVDHELDRCT